MLFHDRGLLRPRPAEGETFFIIRQDWLDNVGMEVPTNTDEIQMSYMK